MWFDLYKKDKLHKKTEETIQFILKHYVLPTLGKMKVVDVKPIHIQQLMNSISGYSHATQTKALQYTRAIFEVAVENGMISRSPVGRSIKASGAKAKEKVPLSREQTDALLKATEGTKAHLLVLILLNAGLRIGEALGLMWSDIDFKAGTLTVNRSIVFTADSYCGEINNELKTSNAHRTIPIPWDVVEELKKEQAKSKSLWVFSKKDGDHSSLGSYRALWKLIEVRTIGKVQPKGPELVERTLDFHVHPHLLRHTCITRWFEQGLDLKEIQYLAGHSTINLTLDIYTHYTRDQRIVETAAKIQAV